jgi:2-methylcitrate dehydratase PrpD
VYWVASAAMGESWRIESGGLHFKLRAVMAIGQPVLEACDKLIRQHNIDPRHISRIRLRGARRILVGGNRHPDTFVAAIASAPFLAAFAFVHQGEFLDGPHFIRCLTRERMADERVTSLADRVEVEVDDDLDQDFEVRATQRFAAYVEVEMSDGTTLREYADIWPSTSAMSYDEVARKFRGVVRDFTSPDEANHIITEVGELEGLADVSELLSGLGQLGRVTT